MKTRRTVYLVIGVLLILLNLVVDLTEYASFNSNYISPAYNIGYFIGSHILLIIGLILLRLAYRLHKKMKSKEDDPLEESINCIGEDSK